MVCLCFHCHLSNIAVGKDMGRVSFANVSVKVIHHSSPIARRTFPIKAVHFCKALAMLAVCPSPAVVVLNGAILVLSVLYFPQQCFEHVLPFCVTSLQKNTARLISGYHHVCRSGCDIIVPDQSLHSWVCWVASAQPKQRQWKLNISHHVCLKL